MLLRNQRGLTLVELTVVVVIASLVMTGLVAFYLNSQAMWLDASTQAMTQRDATLLLQRMTEATRKASTAEVDPGVDSKHQTLVLFDRSGTESCRFTWNSTDRFVHLMTGTSQTDQGPVTNSKVDRFLLDRDNSLVYLRRLTMKSSRGQRVDLSSTFAMYNRPGP